MTASPAKKYFRFTKTSLNAIRSTSRRELYHDTHPDASNLKLRVTPSGVMSFVLAKKQRQTGKVIWVTLGRYPDLTPDQARLKARAELDVVLAGKHPLAVQRAERNRQVTLRQCLDDYVKSRSNLKTTTAIQYQSILERHLSSWLDRPLTWITRDRIESRHQQLGDHSPTAANAVMRILRALFNYAEEQYQDNDGNPIFPSNPVRRLSHHKAWYKETRRETTIKPNQLKAWYEAVISIPEWVDTSMPETLRDYYLLLLMTGLRRDEGLHLQWEWVDFEQRTLTLPATVTKNGYVHSLPLSDYLFDLLNTRYRPDRQYIFPGLESSKPLTDPKKVTRKIRERSGVYFSPHDLRRTFITTASNLGIRDYTLKRLLNHRKKRDVTDSYVVPDIDELRDPMQRITDRLLQLATQPDNVVVLERKRTG
ncbi:MAG: tyrosine-type recombinase/integrase [Candidatus Competibacteraceae bacterium]|nr:tyrosine-type recombinase/integrase [Candidatus Competibacteraceae bacterium]